ncbi:MAG: SpoIIE family protein phosphatase [Leptospiraceae bacterium]|nr:SpoIIE family protein phosphatase [Leptospiraceae bacterium]MCK6381082.1 SpoIIE family protein phosphatase [Leptospiraceae bacterium]NUM42201.1 SpoIIE family protein phosphatase [Leptospiraceae bacterium]
MECSLCGGKKVPHGQTIRGRFNCETCGKEWILEKRQSPRFARLDQYTGSSDLIFEFITLFNSALDLDDLLTKVTSAISTKLNKENLGILFLDEDTGVLKMAKYLHRSRENFPFLDSFEIKYNLKIGGEVVESLMGNKVIFYDLLNTKNKLLRFYQKKTQIHAQLLIPIIYKHTPLGVIMIDYMDYEDSEVERDKKVIELIAGQFATSLRNTLLYEKTKKQSRNFQNLHTAALTLSRLYFDNRNEMIKMILLTISGFADTSVNALIEFDKLTLSTNVYKLLRTKDTIDLTVEKSEIEDKEGYDEILEFREPNILEPDKFKVLTKLGFSGMEILILPLFRGDGNEYVFAIGRSSKKRFNRDDVEVLTAYSAQAQITIENAMLYQKMTRQERVEKEIEIAREIQFALLPKSMPVHPRYEFGGLMIPARGIGGDYFDIIVSPNDNDTLLCIGDVSGKGIPAGLVMATVRTIIHSLVRKKFSTWDIASDVNTYIYHNYKNSAIPRFMSITVIRWDSQSDTFHFSGAGHGDILVYREKSKKIESIPTNGIILGIQPDISKFFNTGVIEMNEGDVMLTFTDGVTEATNTEGLQFEEANLIQSFLRNVSLDPQEMLANIYKDIKVFTSGAEQNDDITLLTLKRKQ